MINELENIFISLEDKLNKKKSLINDHYEKDICKINEVFNHPISKNEHDMNQYRNELLNRIKSKLNEELRDAKAKKTDKYLIYFKRGYQTLEYLIKLFKFSQNLSFDKLIQKYYEFLFNKKYLNLDNINMIDSVYSKMSYFFMNLSYSKKLLAYYDPNCLHIRALFVIDNKGKILNYKKLNELINNSYDNYVFVKNTRSKIVISYRKNNKSNLSIQMLDFSLNFIHGFDMLDGNYNQNFKILNDDIVFHDNSNDNHKLLFIDTNNLSMRYIRFQNENINKPFFVYSGEFSKDETNSDNYGYSHDYYSILKHVNEKNVYFLRYEAEVIEGLYIINRHNGKNVNLIEIYFQDSYLLQIDSRSFIFFFDSPNINIYNADGNLLSVIDFGYFGDTLWPSLEYNSNINLNSDDLIVYDLNETENYVEYYEY